MKQFILIFFSCLSFAQKPDTTGMKPEVKAALVKIESKIQKSKELDQKIQAADKEYQKLQEKRASLLSRIKVLFNTYFGNDNDDNTGFSSNRSGVKEDNRTDPVEEIEVYDGSDKVRGGWLYRLFHKDDYYLKRYKIENNEKVYLD